MPRPKAKRVVIGTYKRKSHRKQNVAHKAVKRTERILRKLVSGR